MVSMACVVMEPALDALGRQAPFFMLDCACGAAGTRGNIYSLKCDFAFL
jgi:hypothetical protein